MCKPKDKRSWTRNDKYINNSRRFRPEQIPKGFIDDFDYGNTKVCGIKNIGNNCYLNSGLQILASCEELVKILSEYKFNKNNIVAKLNDAFNRLLNGSREYDPTDFINCFCEQNRDFLKGSQCCSQNFIRTLIRNINYNYISSKWEIVSQNNEYSPSNEEWTEYNKFLKANKIYPESKAISLFSGITKSHSSGDCPKCRASINNYSFSYFIDQNMYLDECYSKCNFSDVLRKNIGNNNTLSMDCPRCGIEIEINEETKIVKLPQILIFTLERYQGPTNNVAIVPDETLEMKNYIDESLKIDETSYELFAVNIRFGRTANFGHEICQVKRQKKWYEINDYNGYEISNVSHFDCSYGLFYRKKKGTDKQIIEKNIYEGTNSYQKQKNKVNDIYRNSNNIQTRKNNVEEANQSKNIVKSKINIDNNIDYEDMNNTNNIGYNTKNNNEMSYLNSGFQIISSCKELINYLNDCVKNNDLYTLTIVKLTKNIIDNILKNDKIPDLKEFLENFSKKNNDFFKGSKGNSQDFINSLIYNMNEEFKNSNFKLIKNNDYYKNKNTKYIKFKKNNKQH
jgi:ubiquitin C-terminal hydrolase